MTRSALVLLFLTTAAAYNVAYEDVTPGGYVCALSQNARVYYPTGVNSNTSVFPVISFAHGYGARGTKAYTNYAPMLEAVSAGGYVVIVLESSSFPRECKDEWKDQIRSLAWIKTSKFAQMIDSSKQTGILGHSMGGGATYHSASEASAVNGQNIGVAVALHPQIQGNGTRTLLPITNSLVPIFFGTGSADTVVGPASVQDAYYDTQNVSKVLSSITGARHLEPCRFFPNRHTPYVIAMFDCHIQSVKSQCDKIYGTGADSLCGGKVKMDDCEHAIPNATDPCDYCNTGVCSSCKACVNIKTGSCASCWTKEEPNQCLHADRSGCQKCWSSGIDLQSVVV